MGLNTGYWLQEKRRNEKSPSPPPSPLLGEGKGEGRNEMEFIMDREKIEKAIKEKSKDGKLPCAICFKIAEDFGISKREMGQILNEINIRINQCQLGCFE